MGLSASQAREQIKRKSKDHVIRKAAFHQGRLKFHGERQVDNTFTDACLDFLSFVRNVLQNNEKYENFKAMFRYPVKTNEVVGQVFDRLSRIFDGENASLSYQFNTEDARADWESYRRVALNEPNVWRTRGWEYFKTEPNSVLVVDMPKEQSGALAEPYFYWLPIESVITFSANASTGVMDWIIFRQGDDIVVIDNEAYSVYGKGEGGEEIGVLRSRAEHGLGYCPCKFFGNEPIVMREPDIKANPITKVLGSLDWYLFFEVGKKNLDLYGAYPILSGYQQDCDYEDNDGNHCDGGYLRDKEDHWITDASGAMRACPKCGKSNIAGVGSFITIPVPHKGEDGSVIPDLRNPIQILTIDRDSLDYNVSECERLKEDIINTCCGTAGEIVRQEALNNEQVQANVDTQTTILNEVKKCFEEAQKFVDDTICRLRYGDDFKSSNISYGTNFYLTSPVVLRNNYVLAKNGGASVSELDSLAKAIISAEYRNDDLARERMRMMLDIEPFHHLSLKDVADMAKDGLVPMEKFLVKANFSEYMRRFERENMNMLVFSENVPYSSRIELIRKVLYGYAEEEMKEFNKIDNLKGNNYD